MPANEQRVKAAYEAWCKPRANRIEPDHPRDAFAAGYEAALTDAAPRMGEAVAWQYRDLPDGKWRDCDATDYAIFAVCKTVEVRALAVIATPAAPRGGGEFTEANGKALRALKVGEVLQADQWESVCAFVRDQERVIEECQDRIRELEDPHPDTAPAGVRELVGKWRANTGTAYAEFAKGCAAAKRRCADELEQALAALPDGREDGDFPAFLTMSQAWPQGYVYGWNDALKIARESGFGPRMTPEEIESFRAAPPVAQERGQADDVRTIIELGCCHEDSTSEELTRYANAQRRILDRLAAADGERANG